MDERPDVVKTFDQTSAWTMVHVETKQQIRERTLALVDRKMKRENMTHHGAALAIGLDPSMEKKLRDGGRESIGDRTEVLRVAHEKPRLIAVAGALGPAGDERAGALHLPRQVHHLRDAGADRDDRCERDRDGRRCAGEQRRDRGRRTQRDDELHAEVHATEEAPNALEVRAADVRVETGSHDGLHVVAPGRVGHLVLEGNRLRSPHA